MVEAALLPNILQSVIAKHQMSLTRKTFSKAALAATIAAAMATSAFDAFAQSQPIRNVVLVHGAFADGSGWRRVYDELKVRGFHVTIVQNPLTSLDDDVAATKRALDRQNGPTILVGHSWGGTVITEAGVDAKVAGLVYVSALSPDAGETTARQFDGFAPASQFVIDKTPDGFGFVSLDQFKSGFAHDASDADAAFMRDSQIPINMSAFGTKLKSAAWRSKPSWAVLRPKTGRSIKPCCSIWRNVSAPRLPTWQPVMRCS